MLQMEERLGHQRGATRHTPGDFNMSRYSKNISTPVVRTFEEGHVSYRSVDDFVLNVHD